MLIVEGRLDSPILRSALRDAEETTVIHEELHRTGERIRFIFWAESSDFAAFDEAMAGDPTVEEPVVLAETDRRRLYRVELSPVGREAATAPLWGDLDLVLLDSRGSASGWQLRFRIPDREALGAFVDGAEARGIDFTIDVVYEGTESPEYIVGPGTDEQRRALLAALELGYFEVPRGAQLADVADHLGISSQAASERLRRGLKAHLASWLDRRP